MQKTIDKFPQLWYNVSRKGKENPKNQKGKYMYSIKFNTGAGDIAGIATMEEAIQKADEEAAYTQQDIEIINDKGKTVATRFWRKTGFKPDDYENGENADVISYGNFGYYDEWVFFLD